MTTKRIILSLGLFVLIFLTACGTPPIDTSETLVIESDSAPIGSITLYNRPDYINPDIVSIFEENSGILITEQTVASDTEMLAVVRGGDASVALVILSEQAAATLIGEGRLAPLNGANLPNLANLDPHFTNLPYDPGNRYCVPYLWGAIGLGYDANQVAKPTSWNVLFQPNPAFPTYGRTTMLDNARQAFASALIYRGQTVNTTSLGLLESARQDLFTAKPGLLGLNNTNYAEAVGSGQITMAQGRSDVFLRESERFPNLAFTVPSEGGTLWVDSLCIPATASPEDRARAEAFINHTLRADMAAYLTLYTSLATPNRAALAQIPLDIQTNEMIYPAEAVRRRLQMIIPLPEFDSSYLQLWEQVKFGTP